MTEQIQEIPQKPIQPEVVPETPKTKNSLKTILLVVLGLVIVAGVAFAAFTFGQKKIAKVLPYLVPTSTPMPYPIEITQTPASDPTANWKIYKVLNGGTNLPIGISYKLPDNIKNSPSWANAGHYYQSVTLPGNTEFGIFIIGKSEMYMLTYDQFVNQVITKYNLPQLQIAIGDRNAVEFSGKIQDPIFSQDLLILGEGENQFKGAIAKIDNDTSIYVLHYQTKMTPEPMRNFVSDDKLFDQILATFKFTK